ncbi:intracellular protein transport protein USO1-like [Oryzias melastigma]|uniref:Intracellular protein transport protein USO1-like n=1 Tax=Oryzias melastigma TaxID=30732 RepID=A0A3B3BQV0_ORYME|nr:intracellular protein transport protein USO1-like [Oryzias melastigma]
MASQIAKTTKDLTTSADMQKTTQMLMKSNANWEEYLAPAPLSIAIMGELVFISSEIDFSINKNPPKDGFKHIKYPDSFRACLMQVCNSGWQAFNIAHKNMNQIRIHTATVPDYMKAAMKILFQGDDEIVEALLPDELDNIRTIATECVDLADGVEKKYQDVIGLIQELLEACLNAKKKYNEELNEVRNKMKENKMREKSAKELKLKYEKIMEDASKKFEDAQNQYKKSMDSLPTGWEIFQMDMAGVLVQSFSKLLTGLTYKIPEKINKLKIPGETKEEEPLSDIEIYCKISQIFSTLSALQFHMDEKNINWNELYSQNKGRIKSEYSKETFERVSKEIEGLEKSKAKDEALSLCKRGIAICEQIATYSPEKTWDEETTKKLIEDVEKLKQDILKFDCEGKKKCSIPSTDAPLPMMPQTEGNQFVGQAVAGIAQFEIEQSREQLKQCREEYNKSVERMERNKKELDDILVEMQNCNFKKIEFDTAIKMLVKGMDAMGRVKEQWEKMVLFFQMVADILKISLSKTMKHFAQKIGNVKKLSYNSRLFSKDLLYNQALQASNISSLVHMISGTYCEVSNKHLMDSVSRLGRLMAMDTDKTEFLKERQNLKDSCKEAQENILKLIQNNKKDFEKNTDTRLAQIEGGLKAVLPADPEETKRIQEIA